MEMNNAKELDVDDDDKVAGGEGVEMSEISLADSTAKGKPPSTPAKRAGGNQQRTVWDTMVQDVRRARGFLNSRPPVRARRG